MPIRVRVCLVPVCASVGVRVGGIEIRAERGKVSWCRGACFTRRVNFDWSDSVSVFFREGVQIVHWFAGTGYLTLEIFPPGCFALTSYVRPSGIETHYGTRVERNNRKQEGVWQTCRRLLLAVSGPSMMAKYSTEVRFFWLRSILCLRRSYDTLYTNSRQ